MRNNYFLKRSVVVLVFFIVVFSACSKEEDNTTNNTPTQKTLNKSTLTPKKWYSQGSSVIHDFKAGGAYASSGSWKWFGSANTDTMEVVYQSGYQAVYWKFNWNTDHEMQAMRIDQGVTMNFRDSAW